MLILELDFVRIEYDVEIDISAENSASMYNAVRNFEAYFKDSSCQALGTQCDSCGFNIACSFVAVFNQSLSSDPEILRIHQKPALPFAFYIDNTHKSYTLGLVVIGHAVNHILHFHTSVLNMLGVVTGSIRSAKQFEVNSFIIDYQDVRHLIIRREQLLERLILLSAQHILNNMVHSDSIRLSIRSPLRLLTNGSIVRRFDFATFFRSQLRRCSSLIAYYGSGTLDFDFVALSKLAQYVAVFDEKIHYTQPDWSRKLNKAGLTGSVECIGLVEPMLSLLLLGSYFNSGKGASAGMGYHKIEVIG